MRILYVAIFFFLLTFVLAKIALAQKKVAELTLVYNYAMVEAGVSAGQGIGNGFSATHTVYIKGNISRSDITSSLFSSSTIYDANTGHAVVLKEVSGQKLLIRMTPDDWEDKNRRYDGLTFSKHPETKEIAGYLCEKATATTKDSFTIVVYYTRELVPEYRGYEPMFKNLDGLPLEYELSNGHLTLKYTLSSINLNPVPESKFDLPKSGYRQMTYEESKKLQMGS